MKYVEESSSVGFLGWCPPCLAVEGCGREVPRLVSSLSGQWKDVVGRFLSWIQFDGGRKG